MSELSDKASDTVIDEHWGINQVVKDAWGVSVRPSHNNSHLNLYIFSNNGISHVEIPDSRANISDTKYGVVVSVE